MKRIKDLQDGAKFTLLPYGKVVYTLIKKMDKDYVIQSSNSNRSYIKKGHKLVKEK